MSANATPCKPATIRTARVRRATYELIEALTDAAKQSGLSHDHAQGKLSALIAEVWEEAERRISRIPLRTRDED